MTEDSKWEVVDVVMSPYGHPATTTYRLPVSGGWLYRVEDGDAQSVVFVPAPTSLPQSRVISEGEFADWTARAVKIE